MKTASKNKQNTLTNFFTKVPKSLPLNECSNTLKSLKVNALKTDKDVIDLTDESLKNDENICTNKRKIEQDENLCLKKNKTDDNDDERAIISNSSLKQTKQKTIDEFNFNDIDDEFFMDNISFNDECYSNLDFSKLERYKVENVEITSTNDIKLTVENLMLHNKGICVVKSPWNACTIHKGDVVSIQGRLCKTEEQPYWVIDWNGGLLVTNSDHLISGTTVVNSLYCSRKTVLSHMFKEQDCLPQGSKAMFIGCTVHQLLQEALSSKKTTLEEIEELFNKMKSSKDFKMQLFLENFNADEIEEEIQHFIPRIHNFMCKYVNYENSKFHNTNQRNNTPKLNGNWQGEIVEVKDIEENIWSHKLGVKGKVDATVRVNVHNKIKTVPLELKTGKVSPLNLEHRGQVILYCMMLQELGENVDNGLLLYLRDEGHMIDVKFAEKEKRDLILLRNGLSGWLKNLTLVEPSNNISAPKLPKVINRNTCQSCPQLIACSAALRRSGDIDQLKEKHINKSLAEESTKHLTGQHLDYIFHWLGLLSLEFQMSKFSISRIWSFKPEEREAKGWCISNLKVSRSSAGKGGRWEHCLQKQNESTIISSIEKGQCVIIGNNSNIAIAMGSVIDVANNSVSVILDKDIKGFNAPIYLDIYESSSINQILMNNIGILLQNTGRADSLRKHIIEAKVPGFAAKLSSKIKKHGEDIFERLNKEQVRAILQAIAAEKYILIKGLPGAGKTTTMRALIELLARMGKKVLVTSFTHSAIDNILLGLPLLQTGDVLRLGSLRRIHPQVACFAAEDKILEDLGTNISTEMLNNAYAKKKVVGVTCLGCCHPWLERQNFDVCLVDEATQVTQAAVIKPISLAEKFILVGDPKQLPPLVQSKNAKEFGLEVSLFEKLDRPAVTSCLTLQYRMNSCITELANGFAYDGQLKCGTELVANNTISYNNSNNEWPSWINSALDKTLEKSVILIDVKNTEEINNEVFHNNKTEANVILELTKALQQINVDMKTVGVIAAYRDQVNLLREMLPSDIEVNTVDQYQGRDKDIILFSTTKTSNYNDSNDILGNKNRLTVAITRAKKKLIIIGNVTLLKNYPNFAKLFNLINSNNVIKFNS